MLLSLEDALDGLLCWLASNAQRFALREGDEGDAESIDAAMFARKAFAELALTCMVTGRNPRIRRHPRFIVLKDYVLAAISDPRFASDASRRIELFPVHAAAYAAATSFGARIPHLRRLLQRIIDLDYAGLAERGSWSNIDLRYHLDAGRFSHRMPDMKALYRATIAYRMPPIPYVRIYDAYATTHALFFVGDFGRRSVRPVLADRLEPTREYVRLLLGTYAFWKNWDLVCELIVCCACLDGFRPALLQSAWRGILGAQQPTGCVTGRRFDARNPDLLRRAGAKNYTFKTCYHATLVALLAAAIQGQVLRPA